MSLRRRSLSMVLMVSFLVAGAAEAQRTWGLVTTLSQDFAARDTDNSLREPPRGPDPAVRRSFSIRTAGLVRITHVVDPYYPHSRRDPNTGGLGAPRLGDGSIWPQPRLAEGSVPPRPMPGHTLTSWTIGAVKPGDYWISVSPALSFAWGQLSIKHRVKVEFSAGAAAPGETFGPGSTAGDGPATGATVTTFTFDGNDYPGRLELTLGPGAVSGRIFYDVNGAWERLTDVAYDPATGRISFTRPWRGNPTFQRYTGRIAGGVAEGTFTDSNTPGRSFSWRGRAAR